MNRTFLFVPGDSERKLAKSSGCGADALVVDLEDSVATEARSKARVLTREFLAQASNSELWVRINPCGSDDFDRDLRAVMPAQPRGVMLPKPESAADVSHLAEQLDELERDNGIEPGHTKILPIVTERPAALFKLHEYAQHIRRLAGLTWGAEDLSAAVGASTARDENGRWLPPYEMARSLCLFAAAAATVPAFDTVYTDFRDDAGLAIYANDARRDGFSGMLAIHPNQVPIINAAFMPTPDEIARAEKIVSLFAGNSSSGVLQMDGEMIDRPHYIQAKRILDIAARLNEH